ncbi:DapH/DapD/GlmU-related protein [Sulfurovum sp.]|uniref:acyltransferase n=1 Tax=Sulfurovum sp. TaxID=1969726 RepID=UPI003569EF89
MNFISRILSNLKFYAMTATKERVICHWTTEIKYAKNITYGEGVIIGPKCTLGAKSKIIIGSNVRISKGVFIETAGLDFTKEPPYPHISKEIILEDNVWLGANVIVLSGVTIGQGSIIGAGTVVSKNVTPNSILVSAQNRIIKMKK